MSFAQMIAALASGAGIGFTVAAPIGPMGVMCIQRTLASGIATGLATGFGAATVHFTYGTVAVVGLGSLAQPWIEAHALAIGTISGVALLLFALRIIRINIVVEDPLPGDQTQLIHAYLSAIVIGFANPLTLLLFFAAFQEWAGEAPSSPLVAGVFIGSGTWWIFLSAVVAIARVRLNAGSLALTNRLACLTLVALGALTLLHVAERLIG
jgi:threonine/homoserine/homoserine lactone efflux protein